MAGITAIKRKGFAGGGKDASTKSFDASAAKKEGRAPRGREDRVSHGATQFQAENQGFTPTQIENQNVGNLDGDDYRTAKKEFEYNVGKRKLKRPEDDLIGPQGDYPGSLYYTGVPKSNIPYFGKFLNMTIPFRNKMLRTNIDYFLSSDRKNLDRSKYPDTIEGYKAYITDRAAGLIDAGGNTIYNPEGNNNISIPLYAENTIGSNIPEEDQTEEFTYRMGDGQNVGADVTQGYYAASGGRITRAGGGIMNAVPRQGFFLGKIAKGIGKAVGSVAKAAGKVLKSDFGKAALAAGAFYYGGGGGNPFTAAGRAKFSPRAFFSKSNPLLFSSKDIKGVATQVFDPMKMAGLITLGGALAGPAEQDTLPGSDRGGRLLDSQGNEVLPSGIRDEINEAYESGDPEQIKRIEDYYAFLPPRTQYLPYPNYANGGRIGFAFGGQPLPEDPTKPVNPFAPKPIGPVLPNKAGGYGKQRVMAEEGGLMDLGGMEKDYRNEGGFVPIGKEEKADDVPARLSVNEFVFTADAVRNAGGGDIDKGAEIMENMMKNLENGGRISEESQGNTGAQEMFSVSERIGEVI